MAKLGEEKLGEIQFAAPSPFTPEDQPARARAEEHIKPIFPTHEGTVWDDLLDILLYEFELEASVIADIFEGRFVKSASDRQLDMIGDLFGLERRGGEDDAHFRARIKTQIPRHTTRTTIDMVLSVTAKLLDTDKERITLQENFDIEPARFDVHVEDFATHTAEISVDDVEDLLRDIKAAGVRVVTTLTPQFTYRSEEDFLEDENDYDRGYGGYDPLTIDWPDSDYEDAILGWDGSGTDDEALPGEYNFPTYYGTQPGQHPAPPDQAVRLPWGGRYADRITVQFS